MIPFDINLLKTKIVLLKSVTTSLGGSISILDEEKSTPTKEALIRIEVPMATARAFIMATKKVTKYLKPVYVSLAMYGDMVIAMERHPLSGLGTLVEDGVSGPRVWEPKMETNIRTVIEPACASRQWYFDGRYMFSFDTSDVDSLVRGGKDLSSNGMFKKVIAQTIDMQELHTANKLVIDERNCLAFLSSRGEHAISPPIWKDIEGIGRFQMSKSTDEDSDDEDDYEIGTTIIRNIDGSFDRVDQMMDVNLNFALKAGQEIGRMFGYEYVEPLQLSRLMIELHTVNLPTIPKQVKATYGIGMKFTHALAWLLGMSRKANTLETYIMMRSLMTYLTRKGIFRNDVFDASAVYQDGKMASDVALKDAAALMNELDLTNKSLAGLIADAKRGVGYNEDEEE